MQVRDEKQENISRAVDLLEKAAQSPADCAVLPEMFTCPYAAKNFPLYAEPSGGPTWRKLSDTAARLGMTIVGGSIPEKDEQGNIYNTSFVFNPEGKEIAKHRKVHLFDINITGGQKFQESETLSPGNAVTIFKIKGVSFGLAVCYDIRFPELFRLMTDQGAKAVIIPGAFNMTTGPAHWELLFRARALDNQMYTIGAAPALNPDATYQSYGNSIIVSPWGEVLGRLDKKEGSLVRELDLARTDIIREELPMLKNRRKDLYSVVLKKGGTKC